MRALCTIVALSLAACSSSNAPGTGTGSSGTSISDTQGITREVLQRGRTGVAFGTSPVPALRADSVRQSIAVGRDHACVLANAGVNADEVLCWTDAALTPTVVPLPDRPIQLAAGDAHTCALTAQADVYCWGSNSNGQLGADPSLVHSSSAPILVPRGDGTVFSQLAAGGNSTCAVTPGQQAWCWGANGSGQLGIGTVADVDVPTRVALDGAVSHIAISANHACAAVDDKPVFSTYCWGDASSGQLGNVSAATPAAPGTSLYATPVLVLHALGPYPVSNGYDGLQVIRQLALGARHSCGLTIYGAEYCWGDGSNGQLGPWYDSSFGDSPIYSASDFGVAYSSASFVGAVQIISGDHHVCILSNGVSCWGDASRGQLGPNPMPPSFNFASGVPAPDGLEFIELAAGGDRTCAAAIDGQLFCWGGGTPQAKQVPGGPYFDDLRTTAADDTPPSGAAIVNCKPNPNEGINPGPLTSYLFDLVDVFAAATHVTEVQFDLQDGLSTRFNEFELSVYAWNNGAYTTLGHARVANQVATLTLRFRFPGDGLAVPAGPVTMQITQRAGQMLYVGSHSISNTATDDCPTLSSYQIPVRIYAK